MVRNEADIVESFVRHTLEFVDRLVVVDHNSDDGTSEILAALQRENLPLAVEKETTLAFNQAHRLTVAARNLAFAQQPDWIFCLDADEFIRAPSRAALESALDGAHGEAVSLAWQTYLPSEKVQDPRQPLAQARERPRVEPVPEYKVVLSRKLANSDGWLLAHGNHGVSKPDASGRHEVLATPALDGVALAHFPMRSPDQLVKKVTLGWFGHKLLLGHEADTTQQGWHWRELYKRYAAGHWPDRAELRALTIGTYIYKGDPVAGKTKPLNLVADPLPLPPLRYTGLKSQSAHVAIVRWVETLLARSRPAE
ncbi:MAG TPA: glycosyltransferase family 2 protein [Xanthomonadales bacterium]|nr:glycosyltransferase family 2 protein [Xanthomonadales bacterium]